MEVLLAPQAASIGSPELHDLFSPLHAPVTEAPSVAVEQAPVEPHPTVEQTAEAAQAPAPSPSGCPAVIIEVFGPAAPAACAVAYCESGWNPLAVGDHGDSKGYFQLNTGWAGAYGPYGWASWYGVAPEALFDGYTNSLVAKAILDMRGHWSGPGGWTCADRLGIW